MKNLSLTFAIAFLALGLPCALSGQSSASALPVLVPIPAGSFEMGDHQGFVDPKHGGDETPIHEVIISAFSMGVFDVTNRQYVEFLNSTLGQKGIELRQGGVYLAGGKEILCETRTTSAYSRIGWDGKAFSVLDRKEDHPVVCIRWEGAAAYCNWLSARQKKIPCYDQKTWACDFAKNGYRLPTEAEWEWAARGGLVDPYRIFPWGDETDAPRANWPDIANPYQAGSEPWTTPVGFFDGSLKKKADFGWPGDQSSYQTADGKNGYGLYDMSGNVWQFINDWYGRDYYASSPRVDPTGPAQGSPMPDGKAYRGMRGGNWFNGENGHGRVSNRNPSYYRGPLDPDHPYYHLGFRVAQREGSAASRAAAAATASPTTTVSTAASGFKLTSPAIGADGVLPAEFTADGSSSTLPLSWSGAPPGTKSFALIMHHVDPQGLVKEYWNLYNIPAQATGLAKNEKKVGTWGKNNENDRPEYAPPKSQGPGPKTYVLTLYALSSTLAPPAASREVTRDILIAAMKGMVLGSAELSLTYTRPAEALGSAKEAAPNATLGLLAYGASPNAPKGDAPPKGEATPGGKGPAGQGPLALPENKIPTSPNPGQTLGLFTNGSGAFAGYTLMAPKHNTVTYLLDMEGRAVHQWKSAYEPGQSAYLLPNGHLIRAGLVMVPGGTGGGEGGRIEEYDWEGNLVWEYELATTQRQLHHDFKVMPNGHVLALMVERKTKAEALAAGFDPAMMRDEELVPDAVVEIEPTGAKGGKIVWEWHAWDHLIQDFDKGKANYGIVAEHPELIDADCNGKATPAFWNHMNSLDYNAELDQILLSVRGCNEIWILDHSTTTAQAAGHAGGKLGSGGDLVYRWGNPAAYGRGSSSDATLVQQHDAEWIPSGSPGAGNILIFNNGYDRLWSSVEEIVPPLGADGRYALGAGAAYGPKTTAWHYEAKNRSDFFSSEISGAQRLPNGNTLICAGVVGNLFEIDPSGRQVWQYVNPVVRGGILAQGELPGKDVRGHLFNAVFKVKRYAPDYSGLRGKTLSSPALIELPASQKGKTGLDGLDETEGAKAPASAPGAGGDQSSRPPRPDAAAPRKAQGGKP